MKKSLMMFSICCVCLLVLQESSAWAEESTSDSYWTLDGLAGGYDYVVEVVIDSWNWVTNWGW